MNQNERKYFVLEYIRMVEKFIKNNFEAMEMFIELDAFEVLENFLNYYFSDNSYIAMVFLSSVIDKLE
ncbi:hypothetical protein [Nautilia sp.]